MKIKIGKYPRWIGPYQIADMIFFWQKKHEDCKWANHAHKFGTWLATNKNGDSSWLMKLCNWIQSKNKRQIYVHIDKYDTWSMDVTLALIALPMLKQLNETKHGAPNVDDEDVPDNLKSTSALPKENEWDTDSNHFQRWDWVLQEMIYAFECKTMDDWEAQFCTGSTTEMISTPTGNQILNPLTNKMEDTYSIEFVGDYECDWDARMDAQKRISNGFRLFGKYYEALWD
jgi:hypothetical protein